MIVKEVTRLPPSKQQAENCLRSLLHKLRKDPESYKLYKEGITNDLALGYIRKLSDDKAVALRAGPHIMNPHLGVRHLDKLKKLRRVVDAAAKNFGMSLNRTLGLGPMDLCPFFDVSLCNRRGRYAINDDIKNHFSQIYVPVSQQLFLALLWTEDLEAKPDVYVNCRHIFRAKCSPAVVIFALEMASKEDPEICDIVKNSFYMDNFYYSHDDHRELSRISQREIWETCYIFLRWFFP